jgi:hypothetical protein
MLTSGQIRRSQVSAYELTSVAQRIESDTFRSFEVYFSVTFLYLRDLLAADARLCGHLSPLLLLSDTLRGDHDTAFWSSEFGFLLRGCNGRCC